MTIDELLDRRPSSRIRRKPRQPRRSHTLRVSGWQWSRLPMPWVWVCGSEWRSFLFKDYDFADEVRELVLDEIRPGVVAQWSDPRERILG